MAISLDDLANDAAGNAQAANVRSDIERVVTSTGSDRLVGGAGADVLESGAGDDLVSSRDGVPDTIDCGPGVDRIAADASDLIANCETVRFDEDRDGVENARTAATRWRASVLVRPTSPTTASTRTATDSTR